MRGRVNYGVMAMCDGGLRPATSDIGSIMTYRLRVRGEGRGKGGRQAGRGIRRLC